MALIPKNKAPEYANSFAVGSSPCKADPIPSNASSCADDFPRYVFPSGPSKPGAKAVPIN